LNPKHLRAPALAALALLGAANAHAIEYAQLDTSSSATTVVLVHALGPSSADAPAALLSASYVRWSTGDATAAGYTYRWALAGSTHQWIVGAGAGINDFHSRSDADAGHDTRPSARLQSEWQGPAPGGTYYALAQASSFRGSWLATAQYAPSAVPVALEWSRYHERGYQATNVGVRIALGSPRWFLRVGNNHAEGESRPYIGIAYNGF
jgi:hypothetical protein